MIRPSYLSIAAFVLVLSGLAIPVRAQLAPSRSSLALDAALPDAPTPQQGVVAAAPQPQNGAQQTTTPAPQQPSASPAPQQQNSTQPQTGAQTTTPAPDQTDTDRKPIPPADETDEERRERLREEAEQEVKAEEKQRIVGGVMPGFNIVMNGQAAPLSPGEKFSIVFHSILDPYYFGIAGVDAGIGELEGSHPGYGWGAAGYFKRMGAAYADNADGAIIGNAILPVLWHQDPRYFRKGSGSVASRVLNAAMSNFICRGDNGKMEGNYSNIVGNFIAGGISNIYYPASDRGVTLTLENGASVTLWGIIGAQLLEFGPDLNKLMHRHKQQQPATAPTPQP